jgi:hypothetical protein
VLFLCESHFLTLFFFAIGSPSFPVVLNPATERLVTWASRVDSTNKLWFAVQNRANTSEFADLGFVRKDASTTISWTGIMKILVNNVRETPNARTECAILKPYRKCLEVISHDERLPTAHSLLLTTWDSLYVLGYEFQPAQFGLHVIDRGSSSASLIGVLATPPPASLRNPFFMQLDQVVLFRLGSDTADSIKVYNQNGTISTAAAPPSSYGSGANAFGPIPGSPGSFVVFFSNQTTNSSTTFEFFKSDLLTNTSTDLGTFQTPLNSLDFRGAFTVTNEGSYLLWNQGMLFEMSGSPNFQVLSFDAVFVGTFYTSKFW